MNEIKDQTLVSVITPTYNSKDYIRDTIESVKNQTYTNWEMVIVDDGSTDETISIINKYQEEDARIRLIKLERNQGAAIARNTAIQNANGRYIAFLDSDDRWLPEKLERQLSFMKDYGHAFTYSSYYEVNKEEREKIVHIPQYTEYNDLLKNCVIGCLTVVLDKQKIKIIEMVNIRSRQDYALWLDLTRRGFTAYGLQEPS